MVEENMEDFVAAVMSDLGRSDYEAREKAKQTSDPGPMSAALPGSDEITPIMWCRSRDAEYGCRLPALLQGSQKVD
jgi:hypothetical protein